MVVLQRKGINEMDTRIGRLVRLLTDDSPTPMVGEVVGVDPACDDFVIVAWGDHRLYGTMPITFHTEAFDELIPVRGVTNA